MKKKLTVKRNHNLKDLFLGGIRLFFIEFPSKIALIIYIYIDYINLNYIFYQELETDLYFHYIYFFLK